MFLNTKSVPKKRLRFSNVKSKYLKYVINEAAKNNKFFTEAELKLASVMNLFNRKLLKLYRTMIEREHWKGD